MNDREQLQQRMAVDANRGAAVLAIALEGLRSIVAGAKMGDPESRTAARHIRDLLREIEALGSGIEIAKTTPD